MVAAELVSAARLHSGMTQSELAKASGIAQPNISDYESGRRSPSVRTLLALLDPCGVQLGLVVKGSGEPVVCVAAQSSDARMS